MKINEITIEGFRGINHPVNLRFDSNMTVVSGENGAGKTSILQAIEWCLFGFLDFSGTEFQREDAIVNDYHQEEQAWVEVVLDDGTRITRIRKKKSKTGFGKRDSDLSLTHNDEQLTGDKAQERVVELLGLTAEELGVAVHLRQETIRAFIQGSPTERSETVDKMIGLYDLRELISGLDLAGFDKEIKQLETQERTIDQNMIQATLIGREMLAGQEKQIIQDGTARKELTLDGAKKTLIDIDALLKSLAEKTGHPASIPIPISMPSCQSALAQSKKLISELHEVRMRRANDVMKLINRLQGLRGDLERAKEDLKTIAGIDPKILREQHDEKTQERDAAKEKLKITNGQLASLRQLHNRINEADASTKSAIARLQELGTIEEAETSIASVDVQMKTVEAEEKSAKALSQLLPAAAEYLEVARPTHCPVCQQEIEKLDAALQSLQKLIHDDPAAKKLGALRKQYQALAQNKRALEQRINEITEEKDHLVRLSEEIEKVRKELGNLINIRPIDPLVDFVQTRISAMQKKAEELESEISDHSVAMSTIDGELRNLKAKEEALEQARGEIIGELMLPTESEDLNAPLQERINQLSLESGELQALGPSFDELGKLINRTEGILGIITSRETLARLEKDYPTAVKQKEALQKGIGELRELKLSLQDIYQAATEHQRALVDGALETLLPEINSRFSNILGHPVYTELQIIPEEEKKGIYKYWIGARNPKDMRSTYVATRFSTAQRNAAALSIFLAMAKLLPHNLAVLMIDEPTQSMDPKRQEAIAAFLATESENRQIIIATEIPEFIKMLKKQTKKMTVYDLQPWTVDGVETSQ